jgi:hypothetical protein
MRQLSYSYLYLVRRSKELASLPDFVGLGSVAGQAVRQVPTDVIRGLADIHCQQDGQKIVTLFCRGKELISKATDTHGPEEESSNILQAKA